MGFVSRHRKRDSKLPQHRRKLLENALRDLTNDDNVLGIYHGGSLARGNFNNYSDIDLHIIVTPETKKNFIREKHRRAKKWGNVLFFEGFSSSSPVIVTHYDCFVKMDIWFKTPEELTPSIWLQGLKPLYDKQNIITDVLDKSSKLIYKLTKEEIEFWRSKYFAFAHETYRALMREENYYALSNLDRLRWLISLGWYMEMEEHLDSPYGVWSKIEGKRGHLNKRQLSLLGSWECGRDADQILKTMESMNPEFLRLNNYLSTQVGIDVDEEYCNKILAMAL